MSWTPRLPDYAHQARGKAKSKDKEAFALFLEMGTGKSKMLLDDIGEMAEAGRIDRALVLAGKGSYADWQTEHIPTHWDTDTVPARLHLWQGGHRRELRELDEFLTGPPGFRFLIMNLEALSASEKAQKLARAYVQGGKTAIVVDEASKIKNKKSIRTKVLIALARKAPVRRILTGSPVTQSPMDLWSQCEFLGPRLLGFNHFMAFRSRFAIVEPLYLGKRKVEKIIGFRNLGELERLVEPFSFRVMKEDCLDLPPKIYRRVKVELTDEQRRLYEEMRRWSVAQLENGTFASATLALSQLAKMQQILCGHVRNEEGEIVSVPSNRPDNLVEIVEEAGGKVLIWCAYRHDVVDAVKALRRAFDDTLVVEYHGGTSQADRAVAIERLQMGNARFFVATQATGGYGLTLTAARTAVYYSNTYNLEHRLQSEDRCHRIGQTGSVTYVDLVAEGTIEEKLIAALREKKDIAHLVMGDGLREWISA